MAKADQKSSFPKKHIGLFGGSFDPVHTGHTRTIKSVAEQLSLDQVCFIPAARSPFKDKSTVKDTDRITMLTLALEPYPNFKIDQREINQSGTSYTIDTLNSIHAEQPDAQLYFIIGMDAWQGFERWKQWQDITALCHIVVMTRPEYFASPLSDFWQEKLSTQVKCLRENDNRLFFVQVSELEISSSQIRGSLQKGKLAEGLDGKVAAYIKQHALYHPL